MTKTRKPTKQKSTLEAPSVKVQGKPFQELVGALFQVPVAEGKKQRGGKKAGKPKAKK